MALEQLGVGLVQTLHNALHDLARVIRQLVLRGGQDLLEHADKLGGEALNGRLAGIVYTYMISINRDGVVELRSLTELIQALIDRLVLLKVLLQRQ